MLKDGLSLGTKGVDLFFVLSGFLITGILIRTKGSKGYLKNFFARRSLRIFPLYFLSLAFLLLVLPYYLGDLFPFHEAKARQINLWTYTTNMQMVIEDSWCFGRLDHFWSLAVEEHFYLIWPFVVLTIPISRLWVVTLAMTTVILISRAAFAAVESNALAIDVFSLFRFDGMLIGAAVAIAVASNSKWLLKQSLLTVVFLVLLMLALAFAFNSSRYLAILHSMWSLLGAILIVLVLHPESRNLKIVFENQILRLLGKYSYAMYVFQSPLIPLIALVPGATMLFNRMGGEQSMVAQASYLIGMSILTLGLAFISWHVFEKHCLSFRKYFESKPRSV